MLEKGKKYRFIFVGDGEGNYVEGEFVERNLRYEMPAVISIKPTYGLSKQVGPTYIVISKIESYFEVK